MIPTRRTTVSEYENREARAKWLRDRLVVLGLTHAQLAERIGAESRHRIGKWTCVDSPIPDRWWVELQRVLG